MRILVHRQKSLEQIGAIFQDMPWDVGVAWNSLKQYLGRRLIGDEAERYGEALLFLKRAVRRRGRVCGYFAVDGWLFGFGGPPHDPKWLVIPDSSPLCTDEIPCDSLMWTGGNFPWKHKGVESC